MNFLSRFFASLLEFVFPPICIACDGMLDLGDKLVCHACRQGLKKVEGPVHEGVIDVDRIDEIRSGVYYDEKMQTLIHHFKYQRALSLADTFADILAEIVLTHSRWRESDLLIPVPLHKIKLRERSFNQSEEVAKALSHKTSIPCMKNVLIRRVNTLSQTQMSDARARIENMKDVFEVRDAAAVRGKSVILVDDLITTGSTANACAGVLKENGASIVFVLTVARPFF